MKFTSTDASNRLNGLNDLTAAEVLTTWQHCASARLQLEYCKVFAGVRAAGEHATHEAMVRARILRLQCRGVRPRQCALNHPRREAVAVAVAADDRKELSEFQSHMLGQHAEAQVEHCAAWALA